VVRSLLAALGEVWVVGLVVDRLVVCGLVVGSVVVAVDIGFLCGKWFWNAKKMRVFGRTRGTDRQNVDVPADKGYSPEKFDLPCGPLLQAPTTVATSNRPLTAI
jgi:hypothetical protein